MTRKLAAASAALLLALAPAVAQIRSLGQKELKEWQFSKDGSSWENVTAPHSYNAQDGHSKSYYRGEATYRTTLRVSDTKKSHFLLFEGVGQDAVVKVNGEQVAAHSGGYTPFSVNVTEALRKGENTVEVICDNSENMDRIPVTSDFNKNGGLHNPAWFLSMDEVYFSPQEYGLYRLRCETPTVTKQKVETIVKSKLVNDTNKDVEVLVRVQLLEADGVLAYQADRKIVVEAYSEYDFDHDFRLGGIHFWDGTRDPYLYTIRLELFKGRRMLDIAETKMGYRSFELDPERGFFLNGHPYQLRGVSIHQDTEGKATAMDIADYRSDYRTVRELGANFVRLAHYPHNDLAFQQADSLGLIVQTEVPWVNVCGKNARQSYFNNIHSQMEEMVTNLYNHPSIVFWGMWNELDSWGNNDQLQGKLDADRVVEETAKLYGFTKQLDASRFVGLTDCSRLGHPGYKDLKADYISENLYHGWYFTPGEFSGFSEAARNLHKDRGVVNVAEYGAGINPFCHTWDLTKAVRDLSDDSKHFEEYGNALHESYLSQIAAMPFLNFCSLWVLFDFPVANRLEGYLDSADGETFVENGARKFMNDKGLVTRDRQTKKDVFYLYKSFWNKEETTVHITRTRLKCYPAGKDLNVKVYSNAKSLTLYQNDRLVAKKNGSGESTGVIWTFPSVQLKTDCDTFRVVSDNGVESTWTVSKL